MKNIKLIKFIYNIHILFITIVILPRWFLFIFSNKSR